MPYLIDGHNLIPKVPGLSLQDPDDEHRLIRLLQSFCQRVQKNVEVYFDNAPPGMAGSRKFGRVKAVFVAQGRTADEAIRARLAHLGGAARNWTVVSSDRQVQAAARARGAAVIASQTFAAQLSPPPGEETVPEKPSLSQDELDEWLAIFGGQEGEEG